MKIFGDEYPSKCKGPKMRALAIFKDQWGDQSGWNGVNKGESGRSCGQRYSVGGTRLYRVLWAIVGIGFFFKRDEKPRESFEQKSDLIWHSFWRRSLLCRKQTDSSERISTERPVWRLFPPFFFLKCRLEMMVSWTRLVEI